MRNGEECWEVPGGSTLGGAISYCQGLQGKGWAEPLHPASLQLLFLESLWGFLLLLLLPRGDTDVLLDYQQSTPQVCAGLRAPGQGNASWGQGPAGGLASLLLASQGEQQASSAGVRDGMGRSPWARWELGRQALMDSKQAAGHRDKAAAPGCTSRAAVAALATYAARHISAPE